MGLPPYRYNGESGVFPAERLKQLPLYPYRCTKCGHRFEKIQHFKSEPEKVCPQCGGVLERVLTAPGLSFKGAGWYVNDYAAKGSSSGGDSDSKAESKADAKSDSRKQTKPDTKSETNAPAADSGSNSTTSSTPAAPAAKPKSTTSS
jgi:putative FmdB family regulatory protein